MDSHNNAPQNAGRSWLEMSSAEFGTPEQPVQEELFQEPDAFGTLDLFAFGALEQFDAVGELACPVSKASFGGSDG